jgi:hypothetical protein
LGEGVVLLTKYYLDDQMDTNEVGGACGDMGETRGAYRILMGKPGGKRPLEKPRPRREDNIKMDLKL